MNRILIAFALCLTFCSTSLRTQDHSVARDWNEILLEFIRNDRARPVVHARNLFHLSAGSYDVFCAIKRQGTPFFLGRTINGVDFEFDAAQMPSSYTGYTEQEALDLAISVYSRTLLNRRFANSPAQEEVGNLPDDFFAEKGWSTEGYTPDYTADNPGSLGAYLAQKVILYGFSDNANEVRNYSNQVYEASNPPFDPELLGVSTPNYPDRWQPLSFDVFIDQSGQVVAGSVPKFLGAEWGKVTPFALSSADLTIKRNAFSDNYWYVYHDPGPPPAFDDYLEEGNESFYRWNFELVAKWSSHLSPDDGVIWDISPASIGNIGVENFPETPEEYRAFYDEYEGGDPSRGHALNPVTGQPYPPNLVPRGDYARVLAEFWADGPDSETPPGHWFSILNTVMDHPLFERKYQGEGPELDPLEYDVKIYLALGGAMHDAAITAWGIKGYYDYVRPISAIRYLSQLGQRSNPESALAPYNPAGIGLENGYIEEISGPDDVVGSAIVGGLRINTWLGTAPFPDTALGVDWLNAFGWLPYQRPTFVTPNFAGYVSGHSTFSSAAAQVLENFTGDPFFPGGVGEFVAPRNEFLVFEQGPSQDVVLQWATYRDASDQTSLSRIWGGIHPPIDDIPGRKIGIEVGNDALGLADRLFKGQSICTVAEEKVLPPTLIPSIIQGGDPLRVEFNCDRTDLKMLVVYNELGQKVAERAMQGNFGIINTTGWQSGVYYIRESDAPKGVVSVFTVVN